MNIWCDFVRLGCAFGSAILVTAMPAAGIVGGNVSHAASTVSSSITRVEPFERLTDMRIKALAASKWTDTHRNVLGADGDPTQVQLSFHNLDLSQKCWPFTRHLTTYRAQPRQNKELLILSTAWLSRNDYIWGRHSIGGSPEAGITDEKLSRITQTPEQATGSNTAVQNVALPDVDAATSQNWPLTNLDLANSRYSTLKQINSSNVKSLAVSWVYHTGSSGSSPIIVNGVMYVTTPNNVVALDASTGRRIWIANGAGSTRGAAYGDGKVYVARDAVVIALDAKTGKAVETFGDQGVSNALTETLKARYPELVKPADWGYSFNMTPQVYNGMVIVGTAGSDKHIPGGAILALDGTTGKVLWKFFSIPQGPEDEGWEIAKDTWIGGVRHGGGIWATPAVDPASGTLYVTFGNPSPDQDGSARRGINLFTNAFVALDLKTGKLKWYYQQIHHDIWDWDAGQQPTLFDIQVRGRTVKAISEANKNGLLFILNRETGQPINPILETPVPTATTTPGEEPWPTQPIPHTASGSVMIPTASSEPYNVMPRFAEYPRAPFYMPPAVTGAVHAPRQAVGYGPSSFSPQTGLLYVASRELPIFLTTIPVGNTLKPGQNSTAGRRENASAIDTGTVSAYDPATGELVWRTTIANAPAHGPFATAGNLVLVADRHGTFHAFNAKTGKLLWNFFAGGGLTREGQATYQVNGVQYIAAPTGDGIVTFALVNR